MTKTKMKRSFDSHWKQTLKTYLFLCLWTTQSLLIPSKSPSIAPHISRTSIFLWSTNPPPTTTSQLPITELPSDFPDAVSRAAKCAVEGLRVKKRCRIEFDTSVADQTYSSLHHSLPFLKLFTKITMDKLNLSIYPSEEGVGQSLERSVRVFLPDMGAAAMVRSDWKIGTGEDELPMNILTSSILTEAIDERDKCVIIACPLYSEADAVKRILSACDDRNLPCILVNPRLVNPDQGYGVRAKLLQSDVIAATPFVYQLRTLSVGALVHEFGKGFTIWLQDESEDIGYSLHSNFDTEPPNSDVIQIIREVEAKKVKKEESAFRAMTQGLGDFLRQLKKL